MPLDVLEVLQVLVAYTAPTCPRAFRGYGHVLIDVIVYVIGIACYSQLVLTD